MMTFEYINPLRQYGKVEFDLILTDNADKDFYYRVGATFHDKISEEEMNAHALDTIARIEDEIKEKKERELEDALIQEVKDQAEALIEEIKNIPKDLKGGDLKIELAALMLSTAGKVAEIIEKPIEPIGEEGVEVIK